MKIPRTHLNPFSSVLMEDLSRRDLLHGLAAGSLLVAAGGLRPITRASAGPATPVSTPAYRYPLGTFDMRTIYDGWFAFPAPVFAINAPPQELAQALGETEQSMERFALDLLVTHIDTGDHQVLIDPGAGLPTPEIGPMLAAMQAEGFAGQTGQLLPTLQAEGVAPEDIDTVILTHLHVDHLLGAAGPAGPAFPNARYVQPTRVRVLVGGAEPGRNTGFRNLQDLLPGRR